MRGVSVVLGEELRYRLSEGLIKSGRTRQRERERGTRELHGLVPLFRAVCLMRS
jgi:hypothetical protein